MRHVIINRIGLYLLIILVSALCFNSRVMAFDNINTHPDITEKAVKSSKVEQHIKNDLGFVDGLATSFPPADKEKTVLNLIKTGATD